MVIIFNFLLVWFLATSILFLSISINWIELFHVSISSRPLCIQLHKKIMNVFWVYLLRHVCVYLYFVYELVYVYLTEIIAVHSNLVTYYIESRLMMHKLLTCVMLFIDTNKTVGCARSMEVSGSCGYQGGYNIDSKRGVRTVPFYNYYVSASLLKGIYITTCVHFTVYSLRVIYQGNSRKENV